MNLRVAYILLLLLLALNGAAQGVPTWLESRHDFGTIRESDGKVSCTMRVVNTGDSALTMAHVRTACGCTAVDYTRSPIAPGDTGQVVITYSPANRPGEFAKDVWVFGTGRPNRSQLTITGNVIPAPATLDEQYPVAVGSLRLSGSLVAVGEVPRGERRNASLSAYNASTDTLLVTVLHAPAHLSVRAVPDTVPPGSVTTLMVHLDSERAPLWGLNADSLDVMTEPLAPNADALSGIGRLEVMSNVRETFDHLDERQRSQAPVAELSCGPRLNLPATTRGERATATLTIANRGHDPLLVRRLWSGDGSVSATVSRSEVRRGKQATVVVTVDTAKCHGKVINTLLEVMTNDPSHPSQIIRLVGEVTDN